MMTRCFSLNSIEGGPECLLGRSAFLEHRPACLSFVYSFMFSGFLGHTKAGNREKVKFSPHLTGISAFSWQL